MGRLRHNIVLVKGHLAAAKTRDFTTERVLAWTKTGHIATTYYLADADLGDKFVIAVATDTRYGTPVFMTQGIEVGAQAKRRQCTDTRVFVSRWITPSRKG